MKYLLVILFFIPSLLIAQSRVMGKVIETAADGSVLPLMGANVIWEGSTVGTFSDENGDFILPYNTTYKTIIISYVGFISKKIKIKDPSVFLKITLTRSDILEDVTVKARKKTTSVSYIASQNISTISSEELLKAACCNLSESFETNPSIDVNFSDAISATKQIKMLGLTSPYILITTENIPSVRGAAQAYGLSFVPGSWVESIQVTKGAGSVVNGFESITGQINAELVKPLINPKLFVNLYGSLNGRLEMNTHINTRLSPHWNTGLYIHGNSRNETFDKNKDSFLDMPMAKQINLMNKWQYTNLQKGLIGFLNFRFLKDQKQTGQVEYNPSVHKFGSDIWGSEVDTKRFDFSGKFGYVNPEIPYQSLGIQLAYSLHEQQAYFGNRIYDINHKSVYSNLVYNSIISDTRHKIKTGLSLTHDSYREEVDVDNFNRNENSIGGFFEYSYDNLDNFNLTAGLRLDHHNLLGNFLTPRLHLRYAPWGKSALRFSIGRGKRAANIFAENQRLFASNRAINIQNNNGLIYDLDPEIAWNYGISLLQGFNLFERKADILIDFYRTDFKNQVVVDYETPTEINFYNLRGDSYANSLQLEFNYNPLYNLNFKTAFKHYDVKTRYNSGELQKPLTPRQRFFANLSYELITAKNPGSWKFDATYNLIGRQRFPSTAQNPQAFQLAANSPPFSTLNAQITKVFSSQFEVYFGGENMTNYSQKNPILGAENPFGSNFDTTFVYGPIFGSMYYAGLRFRLN